MMMFSKTTHMSTSKITLLSILILALILGSSIFNLPSSAAGSPTANSLRSALSKLALAFQSSAESEPNETTEQANAISIPTQKTGTAKYGDAAVFEYTYVNGPKDKIEDFFRFSIQVGESRQLDISLAFSGADLDLFLFKRVSGNLQALAVANGVNGGTERITPVITLDAGDYFIGVSAYDDANNTGQASYTLSVVPDVAPPPPAIAGISPQAATAGGGNFSLTVNGSNFFSESVVRWNGVSRSTTFINGTQLVAFITAADLANAGNANVTVFNPPSLGGGSAPVNFTVLPAGTAEPEVEPNETSDQASLLLAPGKRSGNVAVGDNSSFTIQAPGGGSDAIEDFFAVKLAQAAPLDVTLTGANSGANLALYLLKDNGSGNFTMLGNSRMPGAAQRITTPTMLAVGRYLVGVSAVTGASSYVIEAVIPPTRMMQAGSVSAAPNGTVTLPITFQPEGSENSLSFSLKYNTAILNNPQVVLGGEMSAAALTVNSSELAQGRVGVEIKLPQGQRIGSGGREIAKITFGIAPNPGVASTKVEFTDSPLARITVDVNGNAVIGAYADATVILAPGVEADVAPRSSGGGDGAVTISDWAQIGRFISGVDTAADGSEFQRADCAPKPTLGDGRLTVADWVMAGRYAAGLEAPVAAGGPATAVPLGLMFEKQISEYADAEQQARTVRVVPATFNRGQAGETSVDLTSLGNENAVGFSLNFDVTQLNFTSAVIGPDAPGAILNVNANQLNLGRVGIGLAMPSGQTIQAGARQIVRLNFTVPQSSSVNSTTVSFGDQPIAREIVDTSANALTATYSAGVITLNPQINSTPTLASLNPASVNVGGSSFQLTVNGTNFTNGATVRVNGSERATEFVSSTQLRATILAQDIAETGTISITVQNPAPGGGASNALNLPVVNPAPALTSLNPSSASVGGQAFTLAVNGTNFVPGAMIQWNGANRVTTFVSSTQLTTQVPSSDLNTAGTATIRVVNPGPGGGPSGTLDFSIQSPSPIPRLTGINPTSVQAGSPGFTLTVNGTGFVQGSVIRFNSNPLATTFVNATQLTAPVTTADIANAGTASITVFNPAPGGGTSNALLLTISQAPNPVPSISGLSPATVTAGGAGFTLTVTGSGFVQTSVVRFNGGDRQTTFVSATELRAAISAGDIINGGSAAITVFNPAPAGGTSNPFPLTVSFGPPTITLVSPVSAVAGGAAFQLTVIGTNFAQGSVVRWNGQDRVTQFISVTELVANISAADIANVGSAQVTVFSPPPVGGTSNAVTFQINQASRPVPRVTSITPNQLTAGSPNFTLTVNGVNFVSDSVVRWNGQNRPTTFVSSTRLTAQIPASDVAAGGTAAVTVFTPPAGGGESNPVSFTVGQQPNPVPQISSISPVAAIASNAAFVLSVSGSGFVPVSVVQVDGANRPTTFISPTQLTVLISATDVAFAGELAIRVVSPPPGGGTSNEVTLSVLNPFPAITSLNPSVVAERSPGFTLTITGVGFVPGAQVLVKGTPRITTFVNSTTLTVQVPAADVVTLGSLGVQVLNPQPGGGPSNTVQLEVRMRNPVSRLTSISPSNVNAGGSGFTLVVGGSGFTRTSVVRVNGQDRLTDFVSETTLAAQISAADIAAGGELQISVFNGPPGGGTSNILILSVRNPEPRVTSISPTTGVAGSIGFALIVNGAGFTPSSVVRFNGLDLQTTFITNSQVSAAVPAAAIASGGTFPVLVINPPPGGGSSNVVTFEITNPASVISSVSPTQVIVGGAGFTLTVNGTGFVSGAVVRINGQDRPTTFNNSGQLTAQIPASDVSAIGTLTIQVVTPPPGGGLSNTVAVAVINSTPTITSLDPGSVTAGSVAFPLTVNGSSFVSGAVVNWNGSPRPTTFVNNSKLVAQITAADVAGAGTAEVAVTNPLPGGGTSNTAIFIISNQPNPTPSVTSLTPVSVAAGSAAFVLTVNGSNFVPGAVVNWNGSARSTTFVSSTQLTAQITAADVANQGIAAVTVTNPAPGGGTSNSLNFTVTPPNPVPSLTGLVPAQAAVGSPAFTLTVNGSGFVPSSVVNWNGVARPTSFSSATQLFAQIPASDAANAGTASITVTNPAPGGGVSNGLTFPVVSVQNPAPAITSISPDSGFIGDDPFTLVVTGTNFVAGSVVQWNGSPRPTTVISVNELRAQISTADVATAGTAQITVFNPAPGGGTSAVLNFTVNALNCQTICLQSPQYYQRINSTRFPRGTIFIGGVNFNNSLLVQNNPDDVRRALQGGTSSLQQLNQQYVALQLSILAASGPFPTPAILASSARCFGLNFAPIPLSNGYTLTRNSTLNDILNQTRQAILDNRLDDMPKLVIVMAMLNGADPTNRCL
ncbi:MAG: beta strand repeat-containing protein [Blastocatellia bacterium]